MPTHAHEPCPPHTLILPPAARAVLALVAAGVLVALLFSSPSSPRAALHSGMEVAVALYVTVPNAEAGKKVAGGLIESKLAACVNMIPGVESMYWWKGEVQTDQELLLMIKSRASLIEDVTAKVKALHPYDTPEVIAVQISGGSKEYLQWLFDNTNGSKVEL